MKRSHIYEETRTLTLGELCEALMDGSIKAQVQDGTYTIRRRDLVQFAKSPAPKREPVVLRLNFEPVSLAN